MRMLTLTLTLVLATLATAAPPELVIKPEDVKISGDYARLTPKTTAKSVMYVGLSGVDPFPSDALKNPNEFLLPIRGLTNGTYLFAAVGAGANGEQTRADFSVSLGVLPPGPVPPGPVPPGPVPPGPTPPPVPPTPEPVKTFQVVLVRESMANMTAAQSGVFFGKAVEEFLTARTTRDGQYVGWRRHDKDDPTDGDTPAMNELWKAVKTAIRPETKLPFAAVSVNGRVTLEALPETPDAAVALFKKYLGE